MTWLRSVDDLKLKITARKPRPKKPLPEGAVPPPKRNPRGIGSVFQLKDGRWRARIRRHGFEQQSIHDRQDEAVQWLEKARRTARSAPQGNQAKVKLGAYLEQWLINQALRTRKGTQDHRRYSAARINERMGKAILKNITPQDLRDFQVWMQTKGWSPAIQKHTWQVLAGALRQAFDDEIIPSNPADKVRPPRGGAIRDRKAWTRAEAAKMLAALKGHRLELLVIFLLETGTRIGEALALQWSDILDDRRVIIRKTLLKAGHNPEFGEPKTKSGNRTIFISKQLLERLINHRKEQPNNPHDLVFMTETGGAMDRHNMARDLKILCERAEVSELSPHELRHTHITLAHQSGVNTKITSSRVGHKDLRMTNHYDHLHELDAEQEQAALSIDVLVSVSPKKTLRAKKTKEKPKKA
jgi:integrase